jgi:hypothetical protein
MNICNVKEQEEIDRMNRFLDRYVDVQNKLVLANKALDNDKKKKNKAWF